MTDKQTKTRYFVIDPLNDACTEASTLEKAMGSVARQIADTNSLDDGDEIVIAQVIKAGFVGRAVKFEDVEN